MAIDGITGRMRPPVSNGTSPKVDVESELKVSTKQAEKTDSVAITEVAREIKKSLETSSSATIIDMERVASVKKALADGNYQINAEKIAEKMIQHEQFMVDHDKLKK